MTRGKIVVLACDRKIYTSIEFNGDMYHTDHGYGEIVLNELPKVQTLKEYKQFVEKFNNENYGYNEYDRLVHELVGLYNNRSYDDYLNMQEDYFGKWFSDYLYMKNLSSETVRFVDRDGKEIVVNPNEIVVFYFGRIDILVTNN